MRRTLVVWSAALLPLLVLGGLGQALAQTPGQALGEARSEGLGEALGEAPGQVPARTPAPLPSHAEATPDLFALATAGDEKALAQALRAGAEPNVRDAYGQTPLMYAADHARPEALLALLRGGADPNARSAAGWTALMYAVRHDFLMAWNLVDPLLAQGGDPTPSNDEGHTAADLARERGLDEVARLLEAHAPIHHVLAPWYVGRVSRLVTETGTYTAAMIGAEDAVLIRTRAGASEIVAQLSEHAGFAELARDTGLLDRYVVVQLALEDVDGDGYPELYAAGAHEGHGFVFDGLIDGASGNALLVETFPYGDITPSRVHYVYPEAAPAWMRFYLAGALAARYGTPFATESVTYTQEVRYQAR